MREQLDDLAGSEFPRIREGAVPLTTSEASDRYGELGIDILVGSIESARTSEALDRGRLLGRILRRLTRWSS
jgi:hypothetical protein